MNLVIESLTAFGELILNPMFYWIILLVILPSDHRIQLEKKFFNQQVFGMRAELRQTLYLSIVMSLFLLLLTLGLRMTFSYEMIIILSTVILILTYTNKYTLLSASYTIGITLIIFYFLPLDEKTNQILTDKLFASLILIMSLLLIAEAYLLARFKNKEAFPSLSRSTRGRWFGNLTVSKISIIPLVIIYPEGTLPVINFLFPYASIGNEQFSFFIIPFAIGFSHIFKGKLPESYTKKLAGNVLSLAIIVMVLAFGSLYISYLSIIAVMIAVFGRALIHYTFYKKDVKKPPIFFELHKKVRVLGVVEDSPSQRLGFNVGDKIEEINGKAIHSFETFKQAFHEYNGLCTMKVVTAEGKIYYIKNSIYEGTPAELGLLFGTKS
ncbi:MAG TPA: PDZ domain-containing protein [Bacillota bacterium]|nr:PDZ domain-containing protein [Bacillota bacterium]